jgi:anthranilate phosphoribosyltransferase
MTLRDALHAVCRGRTLSREEASHVCAALLEGDFNALEAGALLCALHARGETRDELAGFLNSMTARMTPVECDDPHAIDVCGTGGDGSHSFNLSTASALLAAACGARVAKHGNRAVSSRSGSADIIEALNIPVHQGAQSAARALRQEHFAFLFAPHFHPAMKSVAPLRRELGVRTIFNLLGPLANPARVKRQMIGVFDAKWMRPIAETLAELGSEDIFLAHGCDGYDEFSAAGETLFVRAKDGRIEEGVLTPELLGVKQTSEDAVRGGDAADNARQLVDIARGCEQELLEWVLANTSPALVIAGIERTFRDSTARARACVEDGDFLRFLNHLRRSE